jgi:hypothetical protein
MLTAAGEDVAVDRSEAVSSLNREFPLLWLALLVLFQYMTSCQILLTDAELV